MYLNTFARAFVKHLTTLDRKKGITYKEYSDYPVVNLWVDFSCAGPIYSVTYS